MAKTVKSFKDYDFENCNVDPKYYGDYPHANFFKGEFLPIARKEMKSIAKKAGAELVKFHGGYFEYSALLKKDNKYAYVHIGDVRYNICGHWFDKVLYRSAANENDCCGGANYFCSYDRLAEELADLFD